MEYIKKLDFMGPKPTFLFEGSEIHRTARGGLITIVVGLFCVVSFAFFALKLVGPELNSATYSTNFINSPPIFTNENNDFSFYFGVQDNSYQHFYRPDIIKVEFRHITLHKNFTSVVRQLPVHACESADFHQNAQLFEENSSFSDAYCIEGQATDSIYLNSTFGFDSYNYLQIGVEKCTNNTETQTCASEEEIQAYLKGFFFDFGYVKEVIDATNHKEPGLRLFEDFFSVASIDYFKEVTFYFNQIHVLSDIGWIFEVTEDKTYFGLAKIKETFDLRSKPEFLNIIIRLDRENSNWTRKYYKLQDFVAQVGGIVKGLLLIGQFMLYPFNERNLVVDSMQFNKASQVLRPTQAISVNDSNTRSEIKKKPSTKMRLSTFEYILLAIGCVDFDRKAQFVKVEAEFNKMMDIRHYLSMSEKTKPQPEEKSSNRIRFEKSTKD